MQRLEGPGEVIDGEWVKRRIKKKRVEVGMLNSKILATISIFTKFPYPPLSGINAVP